MTIKTYVNLTWIVLVIFAFPAMVWPQDEIFSSATVGECSLAVGASITLHTLRLRAHHPQGRNCLIDRDSTLSVLDAAFSRTDFPKPDGGFTSMSIGRIIDYPWLSQYLANTARNDGKWNKKKGKAGTLDINKYVSGLLLQKEVLSPIETIVGKGGYSVIGVSVEKVLIGGLGEVPQYKGDVAAGRFPYDAQVWFRLKRVGRERE